MATIWAIGELINGAPTKLTLELATLARQLAEASGGQAAAVLVGEGASSAGSDVAKYVADVLAVDIEQVLNDRPAASVVAPRVAALVSQRNPDFLLVGASNDGKDVAGMLVGLTDLPILYNGASVEWAESAPRVEMSTFGGKLVTHSTFNGTRGIVVVRAASVTAEAAAAPGDVEIVAVDGVAELPKVTVVDSISEAGAAAPIEEARIIVGGGRGVGSQDGFRMIEDLAEALAAQSVQPERWSTPAGSAMASRSARPARSSNRLCTSLAASAARSSTRSGSRPQGRSWRSTETRTHPSRSLRI